MPIPKLEITNPQALELIAKIKSGKILHPLKSWLRKYRWYLVAVGVIFILVIALAIGKKLSESSPVPIFTPPGIETVEPTSESTVKSTYSNLKEEIQNTNIDLPDPYIPSFDNNINLEEPAI